MLINIQKIQQLCSSQYIILIVILIVIITCFIAYYITKYAKSNSMSNMSNMSNILIMMQNKCLNNNEMLDKQIIQNMIHLPNDNPALLTNSMVLPEHVPSNEKRKETKMEVLNMFYNNSIDDEISIHARPQKLFIIP